jgi:hypothetical protein
VTSAVNRTWIRDDETRDALDKNSISSSQFSLGGFWGLQGEVAFNDKWASQLNFVKGLSRNRLGVYNHGHYQEKVSEIGYYKVGWSVSHATIFTGKKNPWALKSKLGATLSHINSSYTSQEDVMTSLNQNFSNHNVGIFYQIGPEFRLNNFLFEVGINFEQGLVDIQEGVSQFSTGMNATSNREIGVFTSIRYIIK